MRFFYRQLASAAVDESRHQRRKMVGGCVTLSEKQMRQIKAHLPQLEAATMGSHEWFWCLLIAFSTLLHLWLNAVCNRVWHVLKLGVSLLQNVKQTLQREPSLVERAVGILESHFLVFKRASFLLWLWLPLLQHPLYKALLCRSPTLVAVPHGAWASALTSWQMATKCSRCHHLS